MKKWSLLIWICSLMILPGCALLNTNTLYDAPAPPITLHRQKGEFKAGAGYGGYLGANGYVSYALTNNFAVQGAGHFNHQLWGTLEMGILSAKTFRLKNHSFETSAGFFSPIDSRLFNVFEIYGGWGSGKVNKRINFSLYDLDQDYYGPKGSYTKIFLQANLGQVMEKREYGISARLIRNHYQELRYYDVTDSKAIIQNLDNTTAFFLEPVFYLGLGSGKVKFSSQLGFAAPLPATTNGEANHYRRGSVIFNMGVKLNLGETKEIAP